MQRRLLGAFDPIERIWATVSSSRAGIMLPEVEDAGTTEGGREGGDVGARENGERVDGGAQEKGEGGDEGVDEKKA